MPKMPFSNKKVVQKSRDFIEQNAKFCQKNEGSKMVDFGFGMSLLSPETTSFPQKTLITF